MTTTRSYRMKQVLDIISKAENCTAKEICDATGMGSREVSGILKGLRLRGLVRIIESKSHTGNLWGLP